jgi:hypothetical protein
MGGFIILAIALFCVNQCTLWQEKENNGTTFNKKLVPILALLNNEMILFVSKL